jgi:hypothetical protein
VRYTTGTTQLALASKAGFAISFYVLVLRNSNAAVPAAIANEFVGYLWQSHSLQPISKPTIHAFLRYQPLQHRKRLCNIGAAFKASFTGSAMRANVSYLTCLPSHIRTGFAALLHSACQP